MEEMLTESIERLSAAAAALEQAVAGLMEKQASFAASAEESVERIVATVESAREAELEKKLAEAEQTIAELRATAELRAPAASGRKTVVAGTLMAKAVEAQDAGSLDDALKSLSVEQRIAVKAEMLRSGLLR